MTVAEDPAFYPSTEYERGYTDGRLSIFDATVRLRRAARAIVAAADSPDIYVNMPRDLLDELREALEKAERRDWDVRDVLRYG